MDAVTPFQHMLRLGELPPGQSHGFRAEPDSAETEAIAKMLDVSKLRKLRLTGRVEQSDDGDWRLEAELGATVTQDCVVTLEPVVTRIDESITRKYLRNVPDTPAGDEEEVDVDDSIEPLSAELDIGALLIEELALALPQYPRVENVDPFEACYASADADPLDDVVMKPFAGLAKLRKPT